MKLIINLLILSFTVLGFSQSAYQDGELLNFKIKYGWFNTSKASLEVKKSELEGKQVYHIIGNGKSVGLLDVFFKVRDRYESFITSDEGLPLKFIRDINEGGYKKHKELFFNHNTHIVEVLDFKHDTKNTFKFMPSSQDMLSALYKLRNTIDVETVSKGQEFNINMFFDDENYDFKTKVLGFETIETKFGMVKCIKIRPYVMADRVFEESESLTFWVSADQNKIPIKIEAELAVGSLTAELDEYRGLKHPFRILMN